MPVDTKTVTGRRELSYKTLDELLADLDALEGRKLKTLGNWGVGEILAHVAVPMNGAIDGMKFRPPWFFKAIGRLMKKRFLYGKAPAGFQLPEHARAELVVGPTAEAEGFAAVRRAAARLKTETRRSPSPLLGPLTVEEWDQFNLRHCELHMSFIVAED